jgi:hypothetical protein
MKSAFVIWGSLRMVRTQWVTAIVDMTLEVIGFTFLINGDTLWGPSLSPIV